MPIKIPDQLPALSILDEENIFVMSENRAINQDIRPMEVAILNLMPNKIEAEVQILRMLSNTPLQINIELLRIHANESKHTPKAHLDAFYRDFEDIRHKHYDGLIITGAPLALIDYEEVSYWPRICEIFDWADSHVTSTMFSCWAAHAAMYHFYGINRSLRKKKLSGVYEHTTLKPLAQLTRGFDETFKVPHSRYGEIDTHTYEDVDELEIFAQSDSAGAYIVASKDKRKVFITGHPEYDDSTLADEFSRDSAAGLQPAKPEHYFPNDDSTLKPSNTWRSHGCLLFSNWLNYYVYQITPYLLESDK